MWNIYIQTGGRTDGWPTLGDQKTFNSCELKTNETPTLCSQRDHNNHCILKTQICRIRRNPIKCVINIFYIIFFSIDLNKIRRNKKCEMKNKRLFYIILISIQWQNLKWYFPRKLLKFYYNFKFFLFFFVFCIFLLYEDISTL